MQNLIIEMTATGSFQEITNLPAQGTSAMSIQARTSENVDVQFRGQTTYWTIKADTSRTLIGRISQGDIAVRASGGVIIEIEMSTTGFGA